ncbi:hypothetical protein KI387_020775, partial [Taxus chinensis]
FYDLVQSEHGILRKGREIRLTGCCLRNTTGSGQPRLLPTEHLVILLDEDQDDDLMLIGAQFCSDSFASISLDAVEAGNGYCFYARVEKIGGIEVQGQSGHLKRRQILIADNCGSSFEFIIWDEQILLSNLFSEGSWIALEKPFIARDSDCGIETSGGFCLEYGSATRLYCVPLVYHEEQVIVGPSQNLTQLIRPSNVSNCSTLEYGSQGVGTSQILLRCDSQGSLDFSNFPFRLFVVDIQNKMSSFSLYGVVTFLGRARGNSDNIFLMKIEDSTGSIIVKLNFNKHWSAGAICSGHTVFLSGLSCYMTSKGRMECLWHESNDNTSITNISQLPTLLNSACLHHICSLSELSTQMNSTQVCRVLIERVELHQLNVELSHSHCGHSVNDDPNGLPICSFCLCVCDTAVTPSFCLTVTLKYDSMKISAYCSGQSAAELLQVFPDEFCTWPEDEQAMYLFTIENDEFIVAICKNMLYNNGHQEVHNTNPDSIMTTWRITRALKSRAPALIYNKEDYMNKVLERFNMHNSKLVSTPMARHFKLSKDQCSSSHEEVEYMARVPYTSAVGSLMRVMVYIRSNITQAVGFVSRYMANPDITGDLDGRRSTSGYIFIVGGTTVSWISRLQKVVAMLQLQRLAKRLYG